MRLIDADRLKEVFRRNTGHDYSEFIDIQPTVDVLEQISDEIKDAYNDNIECDQEDVAYGLKIALDIIEEHK